MSGYEAKVKIYTLASELPSAAFEGTLAYAQDDNTLRLWNGTEWVPFAIGAGAEIAVVKAAVESVSASTSLQDDDELQLTLAAGATYSIILQIQYNTPAAADFKYDFDYTGTMSLWREWGIYSVDGTTLASITPHTTLGTDTSLLTGSDGEEGLLVIAGCRATTAGTLKFRWAQVAASGTTTVRPGGSLRAIREA